MDTQRPECKSTISEWAEATFQHTPKGIALHLLSEAVELCIATKCSSAEMLSTLEDSFNKTAHKPAEEWPSILEETADISILAIVMAGHVGFSLDDAIEAKMTINRARKWGTPNGNGYTEHIP